MKRFLCPQHSHQLKAKTRPVQLSSDECSICRWENRPWTLKDIAVELEIVADSMKFAHDNPEYDPHGVTFLEAFAETIKGFLKSTHPDYKKMFLDQISE